VRVIASSGVQTSALKTASGDLAEQSLWCVGACGSQGRGTRRKTSWWYDESVSDLSLDANGNVGQLVDEAGTVVARYEYDAFGQTIVAAGAAAEGNAWRFSTKYADQETGLSYYGYRFYDPAMGRWINRDPAEEAGGANLYAMAGNDLIARQDYLGLTGIGEILRAFFSPIDFGEGLWVMDKNDSYTGIVREWGAVQGNMVRMRRAVASDADNWKRNHKTSSGWRPTMSYSPDPHNGWNELEASPPGTDPETAKNNFIFYLLTGIETDGLHTSAIGSFRIIATVDGVDTCKRRAKINVWMYNEMSRRSFGRFADHWGYSWRPMKSQFMWWNWKEYIRYDENGNVASSSREPEPSSDW
jgi:RHS repeat-associated protein